MSLKTPPHPHGGPPPEPFDGDVYLVRYRARGDVVSRFFFSASYARRFYDEVVDEGGLPTLHRTESSWQDVTPATAA